MCIKLNIDLKDLYEIENVYLKDLKSNFGLKMYNK